MIRAWIVILLFFLVSAEGLAQISYRNKVIAVLQDQILAEATWALQQQPVTVTASHSPRSAGTQHDFYSEGDYWWPDSSNIDGPYVQRDGMTNPDNFVDHRLAMIRFSRIIGALTSAYVITKDNKYVLHALKHLRAWFIDAETFMTPHLLYAQAIKGRVTGRGIGIIDTIHLMEVAQGVLVMSKSSAFDRETRQGVVTWFSKYLEWLTTHQYGKDEMNAKNNHGTCWVMQVASFARLTENKQILDFCRERYKGVLLPDQMAKDGSFPLELKRTKPYGYSIFNLDAMTVICQILSDSKDNLWEYRTADGKSIRKGINFLFPYLKDKSTWPYAKDVMYWDNWPVAHPALLFGAAAFNEKEWLRTWEQMDHKPEVEEVLRNLPIRNPLIWLN
ncbi:alginate lyase family protein [Chryseosolibacter indicus]|uniref:Alginate lyase family protein n=1 Tax=Chryseosolibacter indicus TaxID=2782351 RepID=A0ABS5VQQ2_9BACT|nr:alginate lyase family protein [Chryseosolibacter indicus]MBT1703780.1 alginate lyase family protein [Chryseosolibacter indicus]